MHVALWQQTTEILAGLTAVSVVVSGNDARRNLNGFELCLSRTDDREVGALEKVLAPVRHNGNETLAVHFHQRVAILGPGFDAFFPVFHLTDLGHASLLGGFNELTVIFLRQPLTRKASAGDTPKQ